MIGPGTGVRVYLACGVTDMRKGINGLSALAQDVLRQRPTGGAVFAFRGRRGDRIKLLDWDGQGFCLYYKVLEKGRFPWPKADDGAVRLPENGFSRSMFCTSTARPSCPLRKSTGRVATRIRTPLVGNIMTPRSAHGRSRRCGTARPTLASEP